MLHHFTHKASMDSPRGGRGARQSYGQAAVAVDTGVAIADATQPEYPILSCNHAFEQLLGCPHEEAIGRSCLDLVTATQRHRVRAQVEQAKQTGQPVQLWFGNASTNGDGIHYQMTVAPVLDRDGVATHLTVNCTEMSVATLVRATSECSAIATAPSTEMASPQPVPLLQEQAQLLQQTQEKLQQVQQHLANSEKMSSLGQLIAGVAHEINNPVNFIVGNLDHARVYMGDLMALLTAYRSHYPDPVPAIREQEEVLDVDFLLEDLPKLIESMQMGADRVYEIVQSLKNFSRADGKEAKPVDIHAGIDSTLLILNSRLKERSGHPEIQVRKTYGDLPTVEGYPSQLNQVFMNLLSNAVDALEEREAPRYIDITTEWVQDPEGDRVRIRIADNGSGIPEHIRQHLFQPFFTTKPEGKGTGLGLAISRQIIVDKHQGKLLCRSQLGKGTEFAIELPVEAASLGSRV